MSVLSLVLFTHNSSPIHCTNTIMKFADDSIIFRLISDNDEVASRDGMVFKKQPGPQQPKNKGDNYRLAGSARAPCTCLNLSQPNIVHQHGTLTEEGSATTPEEVEALPLPTTADHQLPAVR